MRPTETVSKRFSDLSWIVQREEKKPLFIRFVFGERVVIFHKTAYKADRRLYNNSMDFPSPVRDEIRRVCYSVFDPETRKNRIPEQMALPLK